MVWATTTRSNQLFISSVPSSLLYLPYFSLLLLSSPFIYLLCICLVYIYLWALGYPDSPSHIKRRIFHFLISTPSRNVA